MTDRLEAVLGRLRGFVDARDWARFHNPKNLAMAIAGEAGELAAEFQWVPADDAEVDRLAPAALRQIRLECADVAIYLLLLADRLGIDLVQAIDEKIEMNEARFPSPRHHL